MKEAEETIFDSKCLDKQSEKGFSLIEVTIAMVILLIALLGVFITFTYAVNYNTGNNIRAQALAVLQQQTEQLRSAKFTPGVTDSILIGGTKPVQVVQAADGSRYRVAIAVDNNLVTTGIQSTNENTTTLKEIIVTVTPEQATSGWQAAIQATVTLRRVRAN